MPGRASDRLAGLGAPPELVDFLRCLRDDVRLDPTGLGWAFDDLPVTPDSVTFSPDGASVRMTISALGGFTSFGMTVAAGEDGTLSVSDVTGPPGSVDALTGQVRSWVDRVNAEIGGNRRALAGVDVVDGGLRLRKRPLAAAPTVATPTPPASTPPGSTAPGSPAGSVAPPGATPAPPGGCSIPFFGFLVLLLAAGLGTGFVVFGGDATPAASPPTSSVRPSSAPTASSLSATTGTTDAPTPSLECAAVFVDHRGRVTGFPSSIIAYVLAPDGNVLEIVASGLPSGQTLTGEPVGGGYVVAEAGIDQYGEYVIERATLVTGSGSEDVTAALIRSLGNDVIRVDAGEGIVLGDPACRP